MIALALDAILLLVPLEAIALVVFHRRTGRGIAWSVLWPNLAAGYCLMLAVRLAVGHATDAAIAACLLLALVAHLLDLRLRWRRG